TGALSRRSPAPQPHHRSSRVPIDSRVQVGVSDTLLVSALGRRRFAAAASISPPAAPVGYLPGFLHVQVKHVAVFYHELAEQDLPFATPRMVAGRGRKVEHCCCASGGGGSGGCFGAHHRRT